MSAPEVAVPELPAWLEAAMPFPRRAFEVDGQRMHTLDVPGRDGPTVLMVHGNPAWSFLWRKVIRALKGDPMRLVAPDLVGFGLSDKPRRLRWHSVEAHVDQLWGLVQALDLGPRVIVVGQDWGGPIGCGVAQRLDAEGRLAGVVLGNTAVLPPRRPAKATAFHRFAHLPVVSEAAFIGLNFPVPVLARVQGDRSSIGAFERRAYAWPLRRPWDRAGPLALARMVPHRDGHRSLAALDAIGAWAAGYRGPAALVWGLNDPVLGRALRRIREAWPVAAVTETQAGHFLQEEVPDALAGAVRTVSGEERAR
jgi:cis-3-alkyl-4-acyloxetan-2-one decarboxylase